MSYEEHLEHPDKYEMMILPNDRWVGIRWKGSYRSSRFGWDDPKRPGHLGWWVWIS
jgi:hypothetical protein